MTHTARITAASLSNARPAAHAHEALAQYRADIVTFADMTPEHIYVRNILSVWHSASEAARHEGAAWYETAHNIAHTLATRYGVSLQVAAGVIAAISPKCPWDQNVRGAENFLAAAAAGHDLATVKIGCGFMPDNRAKACRIVAGEAPHIVLGAEKTSSFYRCIVTPHTDTDVCIDGHACNIAEHGVTRVSINAASVPAGKYRTMQAAYFTAAQLLGVSPATVQAVTWCAYRALSVKPKR